MLDALAHGIGVNAGTLIGGALFAVSPLILALLFSPGVYWEAWKEAQHGKEDEDVA